MPIRKRLPALLFAVMLLCTVSITAFAVEVPDLSRQGSIQITMQKDGTVVPGGTLTLYRVGSVQEENGEYSFGLTGDFADCDVSLDDVASAELAESLEQYVKDNRLEGTTKDIGTDGKVSFTELDLGVYLLMQNKSASGYNIIDSFLVTVPMLEDGTYVYDVDASPKVELEKITEEPTKPSTPVTPTTPTKPTSTKPTTKPTSPTLPQTGQLNWPIPVLVVSGLALFSIGWMLRLGKNKSGYEK